MISFPFWSVSPRAAHFPALGIRLYSAPYMRLWSRTVKTEESRIFRHAFILPLRRSLDQFTLLRSSGRSPITWTIEGYDRVTWGNNTACNTTRPQKNKGGGEGKQGQGFYLAPRGAIWQSDTIQRWPKLIVEFISDPEPVPCISTWSLSIPSPGASEADHHFVQESMNIRC
mgnify:CR=1 FL=1